MIQSIDDAVLQFFGTLQTPWLTVLMKAVTFLTNRGLIWIVLGVVLALFPRTRKAGVTSLISLLAGTVLCNLVLKILFDRTRPFDSQELQLLISVPHGSSFPSGHTTSSFAAAGALLWFDRRIGIPATVFAAVTAFSRLYFQVHYLSDVLVGAAAGLLIACCSYYLVQKVSNRLGH